MKKNLSSIIMLMLLFTISMHIYSQDFTVAVPSTDTKHSLIIPLKPGGSNLLQVIVKNNRQDTCAVSINKNLFGEPASWITVDVNSQTLFPSQSKSFILTIKVPLDASDRDYYLSLNFDAYPTSSSNRITFDYNTQTIIVDKSLPDPPTFSTDVSSTGIDFENFNSYDERSYWYTSANIESGENGIKDYTVYVKSQGGICYKNQIS